MKNPYINRYNPPHQREITPFLTIIINIADSSSKYIILNLIKLILSTVTSLITEAVPVARFILVILDPMILPKINIIKPRFAADTDTASSGRDVPKAIIVRPITILDIPISLAIITAESTNNFASANNPHQSENGISHNPYVERTFTIIITTVLYPVSF